VVAAGRPAFARGKPLRQPRRRKSNSRLVDDVAGQFRSKPVRLHVAGDSNPLPPSLEVR
jgi:hypothetical protein